MASVVGEGQGGPVAEVRVRQGNGEAVAPLPGHTERRSGVGIASPGAPLTKELKEPQSGSCGGRPARIKGCLVVEGIRRGVCADVGRGRGEVMGDLRGEAGSPIDVPGGGGRRRETVVSFHGPQSLGVARLVTRANGSGDL